MHDACAAAEGAARPQPKWRRTPTIDMHFQSHQRRVADQSRPSHMDPVGAALWALYVAAFAFYLFCRSTTVGPWAAPALLAYQLAVLVAEGLVFTSGAIIGLSQARMPCDLAATQRNEACKSQSECAALFDQDVRGAAEAMNAASIIRVIHVPNPVTSQWPVWYIMSARDAVL